MLPSASLNSFSQGMYEPCHGSAPDIAGKNLANPLAMILSLAMAFRHSLENHEAANLIEVSVKEFISRGYRTKDLIDDASFLETDEVASKLIPIIKEEFDEI